MHRTRDEQEENEQQEVCASSNRVVGECPLMQCTVYRTVGYVSGNCPRWPMMQAFPLAAFSADDVRAVVAKRKASAPLDAVFGELFCRRCCLCVCVCDVIF